MCAEVTIVQKINESLREHGMKIINFKKFIKLLTNKQQELYENAKTCYICKVKFEENIFQIKNIVKSEIIIITQVNTEVLHIVYII